MLFRLRGSCSNSLWLCLLFIGALAEEDICFLQVGRTLDEITWGETQARSQQLLDDVHVTRAPPATCFDNVGFKDAFNRTCHDWSTFHLLLEPNPGVRWCTSASTLLHTSLSKTGQDDLMTNCPVACRVPQCIGAQSTAQSDRSFLIHQVFLASVFILGVAVICAVRQEPLVNFGIVMLAAIAVLVLSCLFAAFGSQNRISRVFHAKVGWQFPWILYQWGFHGGKAANHTWPWAATTVMVYGIPDTLWMLLGGIVTVAYCHTLWLRKVPRNETSGAVDSSRASLAERSVVNWWCSDYPPSHDPMLNISLFFAALFIFFTLKLNINVDNVFAAPETLLILTPELSARNYAWLEAARNALLFALVLTMFATARERPRSSNFVGLPTTVLIFGTCLLYSYMVALQVGVSNDISATIVPYAMLGICVATMFCRQDESTSSWLKKFVLCNALFPLYFFSGLEKCLVTGLFRWGEGDVLRITAQETLAEDAHVLFPWALDLMATQAWVACLISVGTLLFELVLPWFIVLNLIPSLQLRRFLPIIAFSFHMGIFVIMGPSFLQVLIPHVLFLNPDASANHTNQLSRDTMIGMEEHATCQKCKGSQKIANTFTTLLAISILGSSCWFAWFITRFIPSVHHTPLLSFSLYSELFPSESYWKVA